MNKYKEISYNTVIFAIGNIGVKLIQFFLLPLLTFKLSEGDFNTSDLLSSTIELILPLLTLSLANGVFRYCINTEHDTKKIYNSAMAVVLIGIIPVAISVFVLDVVYPQNYWYLFAVLYAVNAIENLINSFVRGTGKIKTFAFSGITQALCLAGFSFIFVYWLEYGLIGYMLAMILASFVRIIAEVLFGQVYKCFSFKSFDKNILKLMVIYSLPMIPNDVSWWLVHAANKYICTGFLGENIAGVFAAASKLPAVINMLANMFLQAWSISVAKTVSDEDKGKFNSTVLKYLSAFVMLCASAVFVLLPYISKFLLQEAFYEGWKYSALLIFSAILTCYSSYFGAFYGANFKTKMVFVSTMVGAVVNMAVALAFVKLIGIHAFLLASCLTYLVIVIIRMATTQKYSQIKINYFKELSALAVVLAQAIIITTGYSRWWIQVALFAVLFLIRITDIIEIIKVFAGLFKRRKAVAAAEEGKTLTVEEPLDEGGTTEENQPSADGEDSER